MKTLVHHWELHQGAAVDMVIPVVGLPLSGFGARCHIRDSLGAVAPRLILSHDAPANRRVTVTSEGVRIQIGATISGGLELLQDRQVWAYDVEVYSLTDADAVLKPAKGDVYAYRESTRESDTEALPPMASGDGRYLRIDGDQDLTPEQQAWAQANAGVSPGGPGGASDHGALTGLADDDHPQYHNNARGDARYAALGHDHDADYEAAGAVPAHAAAAGAHPMSGVDGLSAALALLAPLLSPALSGTPTAPTATLGTASTQLATTAFVAAALAGLINSSPGALDTLDELAAALGDDPNFAATITNSLAGKLSKASNLADLTDVAAARLALGLGAAALLAIGTTAGTAAAGDHTHAALYAALTHSHPLSDLTQSGATSGQVPTWNGTAYAPATPSGAAWGGITGTLSSQADLSAALALKAPVASPTFTGTVSAPFFGAGGANAGGMVFTSGYTILRNYAGTDKFSTHTGANFPISVGGLSLGPNYYTASVSLTYDADHVLNLRSGTNAQTLRVSGTHSDASNYVRASVAATSTAVTLAAETAGTGADNVPFNINSAGTSPVKIGNPLGLNAYTVATVPSASAAGAGSLIYVADESGGAVPAFSDATVWRRVTDRAVIS